MKNKSSKSEQKKNYVLQHDHLISLFLTSSLFMFWFRRILNYYPIYSTRRLYFGEVETPYRVLQHTSLRLDYSERFLFLFFRGNIVPCDNTIM